MYKKRRFCSHPPHEKKHEKRGSGTENSKRLGAGLGGRDGPAPACPPTPSPRGVLGSPSGVAMFLKRCDLRGLCSANNSIRAGGLDDGRYGSEELGPLQSPQAGAAEEGGAVVTLHSGQSCRGTPGLRGSTAGTGPPSAPWPGAVCAASSRSGTCPPRPRSASAPGRCSA